LFFAMLKSWEIQAEKKNGNLEKMLAEEEENTRIFQT